MIPIVRDSFYNAFPDWFQTIFTSGISAGAVVAIALNVLLNSDKQRAIYEAEEKEGVSAHDAVRETPQVHQDAGDSALGAPRIPQQRLAPEQQESSSDSRR